ncbi:MAG TPA: hypothetical protein VKQ36_17050, partial [Ktedonobacterales bacterium]|nr:hypothetical protein [Ktedonobacterales bacterium]
MGETPASEKSPAAETVIALLDGRWLTIGPEGVREGQRTFALASLEHAELLPTAPETLAIEVAKLGQIVFQVARRGDGLLALKALYSLRPELRPAGAPAEPTLPTPSAETPMMLPAMPPIAGDDFAPQGMAPAAGSYSYTPYPPYPQQTQTPYSLAPATTPPVPLSGELASFPKSFSDLLAAIFTLYGRSFGALIKLALVAVLIPEAIVGLVQGGLFLLVGINPFGPEVDTTTPILNQLGAKLPITGPTTTLAQAQTFNQLSLIVSLIALIVNAWEATVFTWAAREALYGRRFSL